MMGTNGSGEVTVRNDLAVETKEAITIYVDAEYESLIPGFIADWKKEAKMIREVVEDREYSMIRRLGHDMKGIGGACGFDEISKIGQSIEAAAEYQDPERIKTASTFLSSYLERVNVVYK